MQVSVQDISGSGKEVDAMNTVITIGRQFGSGGREIGEKVAEYFNIKCYDKELLTRAAKESGSLNARRRWSR